MVTAQPDYSYLQGLAFSTTLTIFLTAVFFVVSFVGWLYSKPSDALFVLLASLLFAGAVGFSAFCVTYSVANPLFQLERFLNSREFLNAFITNELSTGVWGLRVSSFLLAYGLL